MARSSSSSPASPSPLRLHLFGVPRLTQAGVAVAMDTRKAIALLAYLALTRRRHSREHLAALLWPEADSSHAHGALRRTLSTLNSALRGQGLLVERDGVAVAPTVWCDVLAFRQALAAGQWRGAIVLHAGDFMAGFALRDSAPFDDWQMAEADVLQRELAGALAEEVAQESAAGQWADALTHARRWLALDPLHEPAHRALMQLHARMGDRPAALRQYRECVHVLDRELGVPPLQETTALYEAISAGQMPGPSSAIPTSFSAVAAPAEGETTARLVGRDEPLAALRAAHRAAAQGGRLAVLEGEAGIGKTRLAQALIQPAREAGAPVLQMACYEGEAALAYAPFLGMLHAIADAPALRSRLDALPDDVLAEAARLLPALGEGRAGLPPVQALHGAAAQMRFFDGIVQIITTLLAPAGIGAPGILFIDDAHWADEASLDLLAYAARQLRRQPVLLLLAWRAESTPESHRLRQIFRQAAREHRATLIALTRLSLGQTAALLQDAFADGPGLGVETLDALSTRLHAESEGLPLFVTEYISLVQREPDAAQGAWPMPETVRDILLTRLAGLDDAGRQLLGTAAVIGRSFDGDLLQAVSGRSDEETVDGLERLTRLGLVCEGAGGIAGYDFMHEKMREVVYASLSLERKRLLHRRAAAALLARSRGLQKAGALAGQVAQHYRLAGRDAEAAVFYKQAGDEARAIFANAEALAHYRDALALGHPDSAALHEAIGELQTLAGDYAAAIASLERAASQSAGVALAGIEHKLGEVHQRRGEWAQAGSHYHAALDFWQRNEDAESNAACARVLADWSLNAHHSGDAQQPQQMIAQAQVLAERSGDPRAQMQASNVYGVLARSRGEVQAAIGAFERSLASARAIGEPAARVAALNNLALARVDDGDEAGALALLEEALALCAVQGDRHREAALHSNLADVRHARGDHDGAMHDLRSAAKLFAEIGVDVAGSAWQPEIWRLTEW